MTDRSRLRPFRRLPIRPDRHVAMSGNTAMAMTKPTADFAGTDFLTVTSELVAAKRPFAPGIVIEAKGPALASVGAKAIFDGEGTVMWGWFGGGCPESTIAHAAIEALESEIPQVVSISTMNFSARECRVAAVCECMSSPSFHHLRSGVIRRRTAQIVANRRPSRLDLGCTSPFPSNE